MADPQAKAIYEEAARAKGKPVFSLMVADFFNAPSVDEIDLSEYTGAVGDAIVIQAHDDFDVSGVSVSLTGMDGKAIESGEAAESPAGSGRWVYTATAAAPTGTTVRMAVTAMDRPGGGQKRRKKRRGKHRKYENKARRLYPAHPSLATKRIARYQTQWLPKSHNPA